MAIHVYVDVSSLACPLGMEVGDELNSELEGYIRDLLFIKENLNSEIFCFYSSENLREALCSSGLYPILGDIRHMLDLTGLADTYQAKDVNRLFDLLFRKMPFQTVPIKGHVRYSQFSMMPHLDDIGSAEIQALQLSEMGRAAVSRKIGWLHSEDLHLYGRLQATECGENLLAEVHGVATDAVLAPECGLPDLRFPLTFSEKLPAVRRLAQLHAKLDIALEAGRCKTKEQLEWVISLAVSRTAADPAQVRSWRLGPSLFDTMHDLHLHNDATAMRCFIESVLETIFKTNLAQTHLLRRNAGGNSGRRQDGRAVAWRRDIGQEYHLHYWEMDGACEFASVVVHEDMSIPSCETS